MNKIIALIVVLILIVAGFFLFKDKSQAPVVENTAQNSETKSEPQGNSSASVSTDVQVATPSIRELTVTSRGLNFTPSTLRVKMGDTVKITYVNTMGTHDLRLDEFNVATKLIASGKSETVTFVASKTGTFEYYCSVGNHRQLGMKGTIIVE